MKNNVADDRKEQPVNAVPFWTSLVGVLLTVAIVAMYLAPTEQTMGDAQRVMYVHIAVAWLALLGFVAMAACGLGYLLSRNLWWDQWSQAACEVGWLCSTLTLVTGSLWAHAAWGTWWTWDPRLVTSFILWAFYSGNLILRSGLEDSHQRARLGAVLAIIGCRGCPAGGDGNSLVSRHSPRVARNGTVHALRAFGQCRGFDGDHDPFACPPQDPTATGESRGGVTNAG